MQLYEAMLSPLNSPVIEVDDMTTESGKNMQQGYMKMFAGAIMGIRIRSACKSNDHQGSRDTPLVPRQPVNVSRGATVKAVRSAQRTTARGSVRRGSLREKRVFLLDTLAAVRRFVIHSLEGSASPLVLRSYSCAR